MTDHKPAFTLQKINDTEAWRERVAKLEAKFVIKDGDKADD
jgi:hypothetical protein